MAKFKHRHPFRAPRRASDQLYFVNGENNIVQYMAFFDKPFQNLTKYWNSLSFPRIMLTWTTNSPLSRVFPGVFFFFARVSIRNETHHDRSERDM